LAATIRDDLVYVHVELGTAAGHPHIQREHVVMLASDNLVAGLDDQFVLLISQPLAVVVGNRGALFQNRVRRDHFARDQILANAEMLQGALGLSTPELIGGHFHRTKTVRFLPKTLLFYFLTGCYHHDLFLPLNASATDASPVIE
jgi:hypothetical protein